MSTASRGGARKRSRSASSERALDGALGEGGGEGGVVSAPAPAPAPMPVLGPRKGRCPRVVRDTVHGPLRLPPFVWDFIDNNVFQRLRHLLQTGMLRYVVPGATHDRFSHSIGTAHLANTLLTNIAREQPELGITESEINTVVLAALCHDLGHGPGSHGFDKFMRVIDPEWRHEHQSAYLLQHMVETHDLQGAVAAAGVDLHMACELIFGAREKAPPGWKWHGPKPGREFLYEIVSNNTSGMDVDKWDYLQRDAKYLHIKGSFSSQRLLDQGRVLQVDKAMRLAWPVSETSNVMNMFLARYNLHGQAFQHRVTRCIESMCMEALLDLKDMPIGVTGIRLRDAYKHLDVYVQTTDWVFLQPIQGLGGPTAPGADLFARIVRRDLWKQAGCVMLTARFAPNKEDIHAELATLAELPPESFVVDVSTINCGKEQYNPMNKVLFYEVKEAEAGDSYSLQLLGSRPADYMTPMYFQRRILRVFAKQKCSVGALKEALDRWALGALGPHAPVLTR